VFAAVHGSWLIGLGLIVLEAIRRRSWRVAGLAGISVVAVSLTAHGLGVWRILLDFAANSEALDYLVEWSSPDFLDIVQAPYLLIVAGALVATARGRIRLNDLWIVIPFVLAGLTTQRTVFPSAIVLLPYAALAFDVKVPAGSRKRSGMVWAIAAVVIALSVGMLLRPVETFDTERFPTDEVLAHLETDRFFHDDAVGGYLIYRDWPEDLIYIDDRAELYGAEFFAEHQDARNGTYQELFDRYQMTEALVRPRWALNESLRTDGWVVVYEDEDFVVMREP